MELPISLFSPRHIAQAIKEYTESLLEAPTSSCKVAPFIMPLVRVEKTLHNHYVSQKPLAITFEYYNHEQRIVEKTIKVSVKSPVRLDRRIILIDLESQHDFILSVEQILRVYTL